MLRGILDDPDGEHRLTIVAGEAGIGKTRLLDEFAALAEPALVIRGGCVENVAYAPWVDALWWLLEASSLAMLDALPERTRARLGRLLPQLATEVSTADEDDGRHLLFEAVVELFAAVAAESRLVVVVDDVHWIDPASADLLRYVVDNRDRADVQLVVAFRPEETGAVHELLADLERAGPVHIDLEPLADDAVTQIVSYLLDDGATDDAIRRIIETADGNPLFVEELVAAAHDEHVPHTLRDLMLVRFNALGDDARRLVRIAAIIGARIPQGWLIAATELPLEQATAAAGEAVEAGVLLDEGHGAEFAFRHDLLRRSVISDLVADERVAFHRAVARALTDRPELVAELDYVAELARHWHEAEVPAPALQWLVAAGHRANESYAFDAATTCYERALVWWDEVPDAPQLAAVDHFELLLVAARANASAGHVDRAAALGEAAMSATVDLPPNRAIDAVARLYSVMWTADRAGELFAFVGDRLQPQLDAADPAVRAHYLEKQAKHLLGRIDDDEMRVIAARLMEAIEGLDDPHLEATVHEVMARCYEAWGENDKVDAEYEQAASLARTAENLATLTVVRYNHACFKLAVADLAACLVLLDDVDELVERYGLRRFVVPASCLRTVACCLQGDLAAAEQTYSSLADLRLQGYDAWFRAYVGSLLMLFSGDYAAAVAMLRPETVGVDAVTDSDFGVEMAIVAADALAWRGDLDGARRTADAGLARLQGFYEISSHGWIAMIAMRVDADTAEHADATDDPAAREHARAHADELASSWRAAVANANAAYALLDAYTAAIECEHARAHGRATPALARTAADAFEEIGYGYDATVFRWREANATLAGGDRRAATELLAAVRDAAARHGFGGIEAAAATLAREHQLRLGAGRTTVDGDVPLSPRELEVLRLVVEGLTNPQIAASLRISPHTARAHVSNVLSKLDATSRVEAVTEAQRRGLVHDALNATTAGADHS